MEPGRPASFRVASLQFGPVHGQVAESIHRAESVLESSSSLLGDLDAIVLPEMCLTGYEFAEKRVVSELIERCRNETLDWAGALARRHNCLLVMGHPRKEEDGADLYNSQVVYGPDGKILMWYDKHFLYDTDKTWASEGKAFQTFEYNGLKLGLGICMDINPYEFTAPFEAFEFATFHSRARTDAILFSSAWCNRSPNDPVNYTPDVSVSETINYWALRLHPLVGQSSYFICADRVGMEGITTFCGSSCHISLKEPALLGNLDATEESVLVSDLSIAK